MNDTIKNFSEIYKAEQTNTLLTGNGFNLNFGYDSGYRNLFEAMESNDPNNYQLRNLQKVDYDLEKLLDKYKEPLAKKAITTDFIKALMRIVQNAEDSKEEAGNFISKFNNIFTLNYDPFLYKIALYLAKKNKQITSEFGQLISGHEQEFDDILLPNDCLFDDLNKTEKATLYAACLSAKGKKTAFIKEAMTYLSQKGTSQTTGWKMNDGFSLKKRKDFLWQEDINQNLFYLHGALHIYQDTSEIKKISVGRLDTLKSRIIERIDESKPLDIIFKSTDKIKDINNNQYMKSALEQLKKITGNIYLYGVSLSENDNHIWDAINDNGKITQVYVSVSSNGNGNSDLKMANAKQRLPKKKNLITLFDSGSINK